MPTAGPGKPGEPSVLERRPKGTVTIPNPDGAGHYTVRQPVKTVRSSTGEVIELRQLTPEEKAARRFRRNIIMMVFGLVVLLIVIFILLNAR